MPCGWTRRLAVGREWPVLLLATDYWLLASFSLTVIDKCGQATKGAGWMSWHREATKDVVACDMLREAGKRALIRRFLNEETQLRNPQLPAGECIAGMERTQGTETSHYLEE
jgi:hypothetical protein